MTSREQPLGAGGRTGESAEGASLHLHSIPALRWLHCTALHYKKAADTKTTARRQKTERLDFQKSLGALAVSATDEPKSRLPMQPNAAPAAERLWIDAVDGQAGKQTGGQGIDDLRERDDV